MKKLALLFLLLVCTLTKSFAQNGIMDVEQLQHKADSVASEYLQSSPVFYGYSAQLHKDEESRLTTFTFPLDAVFRFALMDELRIEGVGITVRLDAKFQPDVAMGNFLSGKLPIEGEYMKLEDIVKIFTTACPDFEDITTVTFFHSSDMDEPVYIFSVMNDLFIVGAVSGKTQLIER